MVGAALTIAALLILWPGLYGGFYLDDFPNLGSLPGSQEGFAAYLNYLLDPPVGGSGRPLAYLSFLLQAESWPSDPYSFKLANLLIHLVNGALVAVLAYIVGRTTFATNSDSRALVFLSLISGFVWVVLPLNMSSVFYVVQRMTLLSTTMTLVSLIGYCSLRSRRMVWGRREYVIATCIVGVGYLGVFAKETSVLTGLLILALEYSVFSGIRRSLSRSWKFLVLLLPVLLVFGYLLVAGRIFGEYSYRPFTFVERLLSENVILFDYAGKVVAPTPSRINLYNDGYPFTDVASNYLLVGCSVLALIGLLILAWSRKSRFVSLGILFFLAGHVLESTVIPLELYFEHRNYLPSVGLVIALTLGLGAVLLRLRESSRIKSTSLLVVIAFWVGWLGVVAAIEARTWGDPRSFAVAAYTERPQSLRARQELGSYLMGAGDYMGAANILYGIDSQFGVFAGTYSQLLLLKCYEPEIPLPNDEALASIFAEAKFDRGVGPALQSIWKMKRSGGDQCSSVTNAALIAVIDALLENPAFKNRNNLYVLKSLVLADQGKWVPAAKAIGGIPSSRVSVDELILAARYYGHAGDAGKALKILGDAEELISGPLSGIVHRENIQRVRGWIEIEASNDRKEAPPND